MKLAPITFAVAFLLAGCGSTTPTSPPPSSERSPVARVDASAPVVNGVEAPPSSGDPAPSASAAPQSTPTPDPDPVRTAAATGFQADGVDNWQALNALSPNDVGKDEAAVWGRYLAALKQLPAPADTATALHALIRKVTRLHALLGEQASAFAAGRMARFYTVARQRSNTLNTVERAAGRVRTDLGLPLRPFHLPDPPSPDFSYP